MGYEFAARRGDVTVGTTRPKRARLVQVNPGGRRTGATLLSHPDFESLRPYRVARWRGETNTCVRIDVVARGRHPVGIGGVRVFVYVGQTAT